MKRRDFVSKTTFATGGLIFSEAILNQLMAQSSETSEKIAGSWTVNMDGSYDIVFGEISLIGCYPAFNGVAIKPISISTTSDSIRYSLIEGFVNIGLKTENGKLILSSSIEGFKKAPHWFQPLSGGKLMGIEKFFYQGIGFGGPSGVALLNDEPYKTPIKTEKGSDETWMLESYLLSAMIANSGKTLAIAALDHSNYLQKSTLYNKEQRWGLINRHLLNEEIYFQSEFSLEEIEITEKVLKMPDLVLSGNSSAFEACSGMAKNIASSMNVKPMKEPRYHWCSWYIRQKDFSFADLTKFISDTNKQSPKPYFQTVQIDDGYQTYYGDWLDFRNEFWPEGIKPAFDYIQKSGYKAGVWIGAFMVHKKSKLFAEHPDWCLKKVDGSYFEEMGGSCVILDSSHPDAMNYLRKVFRYMRQSGVSFYKTDFMDWGLQDSVKAKRYAPGKTSVQYYREVLKMIREEIGEESYWLACISPFPPFLGYADGVRVANDTPEVWTANELDNVYNQMQNLHYANNILFQNDPDVMYLNNKLFNYSNAEIKSFAYFCGIMGGSVNTSEWLNDAESVKLWRFLAPSGRLEQAELPFWSKSSKLMVAIRKYPEQNAWGVLITNLSNTKTKEQYSISDLVKEKEMHVFEWNHISVGYIGKKNSLEQILNARESVLYYISKENKAPSPNFSIGGKLWK